MNTNYEAIKSLIALLVKKSGYDINSTYSEDELRKTKETINNLNNKNDSLTEEEKSALIYNLKIRQANWENSAEIIGKSLLKDYKSGVSYSNVKEKVKLLVSLANKDLESNNDESLMSYLYEKIKSVEKSLQEIDKRIKENDYFNEKEKEIDNKLLSHLKNKVDKYSCEIKDIDKELADLNSIEEKDNVVVEKLKSYINNIKKDIESLKKVKKRSLNKGITLEIWEKIETIELEIKEKLEKAKNVMSKSEQMIENAKNKRELLLNNKSSLEEEISKNSNSINDLEEKIRNADYIDYTKKISDMNEKELLRIELSELKNKKDAIYINTEMVETELIREWNKGNTDTIFDSDMKNDEEIEEEKNDIESEPITTIEDEKEEKPIVEKEEHTKKETAKTHIEFNW